jgi:hypothetical protein
VVWSSSNNAVAKVRNGVITAIAAGTATITAAWTEDPSIFATCDVTITAAPQGTLGDGSKRISISPTDPTKFVVGPDDKEIWMNGVNTPWINWNEFGGTFDYNAWNQEFQKLQANGVNSCRVWFQCQGVGSITFDQDGYCTGMTDTFWNNCDQLFQLAAKYHIYIYATLASFDCFKEADSPLYGSWRAMMSDSDHMDSYVENCVVPFVNHYGSSDYLWAIDLCNEIEWEASESDSTGANFSWDTVSDWVAKQCVGIHEADPQMLVTLGLSYPKYMVDQGTPAPEGVDPGDKSPYEGNMVADGRLASFVPDANPALARLDFLFHPLLRMGRPVVRQPVRDDAGSL